MGIENMADIQHDDWQCMPERRQQSEEELPIDDDDGGQHEAPRTWITVDLYHGLTPAFLTKEWTSYSR